MKFITEAALVLAALDHQLAVTAVELLRNLHFRLVAALHTP
jgi:hypothetical protein